jgi:hypothetical protein
VAGWVGEDALWRFRPRELGAVVQARKWKPHEQPTLL